MIVYLYDKTMTIVRIQYLSGSTADLLIAVVERNPPVFWLCLWSGRLHCHAGVVENVWGGLASCHRMICFTPETPILLWFIVLFTDELPAESHLFLLTNDQHSWILTNCNQSHWNVFIWHNINYCACVRLNKDYYCSQRNTSSSG